MAKLFSILGCVLLLSLTACKSQENQATRKEELRLNILSDPSSLHPQKAKNLQSLLTSRLLFDGLMRIGPDGKPHEAIAQSYSVSEDGKLYTFTLREAFWSNGERVKASDFATSWKNALSPLFPCPYAFHLFVIKNGQKVKANELSDEHLGVRVIDERTLEVALEEAVPYFLELLAFPTFFPTYQEEKDPSWNQNIHTLVTNGPYTLTTWEKNNKLTLKKNETFWNADKSHFNTIELYMVDINAGIQLFEKGEIDWMGSPIATIPLEAIAMFSQKQQLKKTPFLGTYYIRFNTQNPLLSSQKIRKALALCIDREKITKCALNNSQEVAGGFVPPYLFSTSKEQKEVSYDCTLAKQLFEEGLQEIGVKREEVCLTYLHSVAEDRHRLIAQILQEGWKQALGIDVKIEALESKFFFSKIDEKAFDIAYGSWIADFRDPMNFLENFISKKMKTNATGWENSRFSSLLMQAKKEVNQQSRLTLMQEAEEVLLEEVPIVPIFHYNMLYVQNQALKNVVLDDCGVWDVSQAYFDEEGMR